MILAILGVILINGCAQEEQIIDEGGMIACTEEAKICPDGTAVGRNPELDCEFDPCPEAEEIDKEEAKTVQGF